MKGIYRIFISLAIILAGAVALSSCRDDIIDDSSNIPGDGDVTLNLSLRFPAATEAYTRTFGEMPESALDLYLFIFDDGILVETAMIPSGDQTFADAPFSTFKVKVKSTSGDAVIHLIAVNDPQHTFADALNSLELWGTEATVMNNANFPYTSDGQDAYWQRVELGGPLSTSSATNPKLQNIPMIRNFAKVTVDASNAQVTGNKTFEFEGFEIVNTRNRGSVVPTYVDDYNETQFAVFDTEGLDGPGNSDLSYYELITAQGYAGKNAPGATRIQGKRSEDLPTTESWDIDSSPKYLYERTFSATNRVFIILKGKFNGQKSSYYKLDIGSTDENNLFSYHNILRNVDYHFVINSVGGNGYPTPAAAAAGITFNNISASVETRNMLSLSDGNNMIYVNFTSYVLVDPDQEYIDFRYKYYDFDAQGHMTLNNSKITTDHPTLGLVPGNVIDRIGDIVQVEDGWMQVKIYPKAPTDQLRQQSFVIFDPNGLSRTITLTSKLPWEFVNINTFPGLFENFDHAMEDGWNWSDDNKEIGWQEGSELTLFFELPPGLPEAMFPLQFVIESNKQNIQNAYVGNAVVQSGPSLFNPDEIRIQYLKTIQYSDYDIENDENPDASRIVKVRFLTITDLADDNIGQPDGATVRSETTLKVSNKYFREAEDTFVRFKPS